MADPGRPLPRLDELDTAPFWRATAEGRLTYLRCAGCGSLASYTKAQCTGCTTGELEEQEASGRGTLYSYSLVRQMGHPFFRARLPYLVAWIDLEEGPRLLSNLVEVDDPETDVHIGMAVELVWEEHDDLRIPLFRPVQ